MGEACHVPLVESSFVPNKVLELIVCDVWVPAPVSSLNRNKYYILFVYAFTKFSWMCLITHHSQVSQKVLEFRSMVER